MALELHSCGAQGTLAEVDFTATALPDGIVWIDLVAPTAEEAGVVERATGLHVPTRDELSEIESSSRLRTEKGAFYLSMPMIFRRDGHPVTTPLGFVLTQQRMITVRFERFAAFDSFGKEIKVSADVHPSSVGAFAGLLDAIVDQMADVLEEAGGDLDDVSHWVFRAKEKTAEQKRPARAESDLRETIRRIGRTGDLVSKIRDSLMGVGRIVPYVSGRSVDWLPAVVRPALETLRLDVASLNDYDAYLSAKVQFLLDATLGLINIEQNNIIKVLTVVSVVGVPPTLVASWYGMNFKHMPELDWSLGYPYAIVLALVSAILPLVWLKVRGWF
jgi:magnesium transporter